MLNIFKRILRVEISETQKSDVKKSSFRFINFNSIRWPNRYGKFGINYRISSKKFGQTNRIKKSKWPFSDNFYMQKLIFQTESMSQCHLKIQICMQKLLKIGRLLSF